MPGWSALRVGSAVLLAAAAVVGWSYLRADEPETERTDPRALRAQPSSPMAPQAMEAEERPRVLILGDSIAGQAGSSAAFALEQAGVETEVLSLWGQGLFDRSEYDMGVTNPHPPDGTMMAAASQAVADFAPDVVAVYSNHNYWPPYPRDAAGQPIALGSRPFVAMARTQLAELTRRLTAGGASVYLVEPVPGLPGNLADTADNNPIWTSYLSVRQELGLGVLTAGHSLATPSGGRLESVPDCRGRGAWVRPAGDLHLTYLGAGRMGTELARELAGVLGVPPQGIRAPAEAPVALLPLGGGYRLVSCDGANHPFGVGAPAFGRLDLAGGRPPGDPIVAAALAPPGDPVWAVTAGGRVLEAGGAPRLGDARPAPGERAVGIAATASGEGYWVATSDGRVSAFGDADPLDAAPTDGALEGDTSRGGGDADVDDRAADAAARDGDRAAEGAAGDDRVVAMAGTADHRGYLLLYGSGRVAAFGTARAAGHLRSGPEAAPPVAIGAHPGGDGYWILDRSGGVHAFGAARDWGSARDQPLVRLTAWRNEGDYDTERVPASELPTQAVALLPTVSGEGYWVLLANGAVCRFGDADALGGIHRAEIDELMLFLGLPYYAEGPCTQDVGFGGVTEAQIDASQQAPELPLDGPSPGGR